MAIGTLDDGSVPVGARQGLAWVGTTVIAPAAPTVIDLTNVNGVDWLALGCAITFVFPGATGYYMFSKVNNPSIVATAGATAAQIPDEVPQNTRVTVRIPRVRTPGTAPYRYLAVSASAAVVARITVSSE